MCGITTTKRLEFGETEDELVVLKIVAHREELEADQRRAEELEQALAQLGQNHQRFEESEDATVDAEHLAEGDLVYLKDGEEGPKAEGLKMGLGSPLYGADAYLDKPFDMKELADEVARLLADGAELLDYLCYCGIIPAICCTKNDWSDVQSLVKEQSSDDTSRGAPLNRSGKRSRNGDPSGACGRGPPCWP